MHSILSLLFRLFVLPAFGQPLVAVVVSGTTRLTDGLVRKRAQVTLDATAPVAGYDLGTAAVLAALGLSRYALNDAQTGFQDPIVTGVNQTGILAEIKALKLLLSFPTGGSVAAPATNLPAPVGATGGTAVTSSAATLPITPGVGKACVNNTDMTGVIVFIDAYGYPA